ncbi:STAS domain-containing protein [Streptomyces sp. CA-111067]|uniref:STAS domain-containing protein n=1 Tax=Streptomyces sp. CA-111067 TaxID=3240046 RepID=UPI003D99B590
MSADSVPPVGDRPRLTVTVELGEPTVLTVAGESDLDSIGPLHQAVEQALDHHPQLVLDLAGVSFADSTFLRALLLARSAAAKQAGSVRLLAVSISVQRILDLTGVGEMFPVIADGQLKQS